MKHKEFKINSYDNLKIFGQCWLPDGETKAVINLIHGIGEHSTRYSYMAEYYTKDGVAIYAIDYRGHGKSDGKRGHTPDFESLMKDIDKLMEFSANDNSCKNTFIYGHSLGGNLVLNYVIKRKPNIKGVIAGSAWIKLGFEPPKFKVSMANFVQGIFPSLAQKTGLKLEEISKNTTNIETYKNDSLVHDKITVKLFVEIYNAAIFILENASKTPLPILLMHGSDDKITSPEGSKLFAKKANNSTLKIWDGLYHEIHNEDNKEQIYDYVIKWISNKLE